MLPPIGSATTPALLDTAALLEALQLELPASSATAGSPTAATAAATFADLLHHLPAPQPESVAAEKVDQASQARATQATERLAQAVQALTQELKTEAQSNLMNQMASLSAGADPMALFSGLPVGATATLLGGGWASPQIGSNLMTQLIASYYFNLGAVHAVTPTASHDASADVTQHSPGAEAALQAYGPRTSSHQAMQEAVGPDFKPKAAAVDIQD